MSFGKNVTATKIELIKIRRSLQVSTMVHKILDDKREVLLKKIDEMIEEANKTRMSRYLHYRSRPKNQAKNFLMAFRKQTCMLTRLPS